MVVVVVMMTMIMTSVLVQVQQKALRNAYFSLVYTI